MDIYNNLLEQYQNLTEDEKNALLVYKSKLGVVINEMSRIRDFEKIDSSFLTEIISTSDNVKSIYLMYKKYLDEPKNLFLKYSVFKDIDPSSMETFVVSLRNTYQTIQSCSDKIRLPKDIYLYRGVAVQDDKKKGQIALSNIVSSSMNPDVCEMFLYSDNPDNTELELYQFQVSKGTPVLVCPYSIVIEDRLFNELKIKNEDSQQEIILFKDKTNMDIISKKEVILEDNTILNIYKTSVEHKEVINYSDGKMV